MKAVLQVCVNCEAALIGVHFEFSDTYLFYEYNLHHIRLPINGPLKPCVISDVGKRSKFLRPTHQVMAKSSYLHRCRITPHRSLVLIQQQSATFNYH